jgi:hypothetical protein
MSSNNWPSVSERREAKWKEWNYGVTSPLRSAYVRSRTCLFSKKLQTPAALPEFAQSHDSALYSSHPLLPQASFRLFSSQHT